MMAPRKTSKTVTPDEGAAPEKSPKRKTAPPRQAEAASPAPTLAEPANPPGPAIRPAPLVEDLMAPEVFASEAFSISLVQGVISIAFTSPRYDYSENPSVMKKVVVSRLVIPPAGALSMAVRLFALLDKHGLGAAPKDPQARQ
jgi:hypothetical protein